VRTINDYIFFIAEIKAELTRRQWRYADLAKAVGNETSTIYSFMSRGGSEKLARKIAKALHIER